MSLRHRIVSEFDLELESVELQSGAASAFSSSPLPDQKPLQHTPCKFCKFVQSDGATVDTELIHRDEFVLVIRDLHPAARLHLQVLPREHIRDIRELKTREHAQLLQQMQNVAEQMLEKYQLPGEEFRLGFHVPPRISVQHLHLHVLSGPFNNVWFGTVRNRFVCCFFPRIKFIDFFGWWFKPLAAVRADLQNQLE